MWIGLAILKPEADWCSNRTPLKCLTWKVPFSISWRVKEILLGPLQTYRRHDSNSTRHHASNSDLPIRSYNLKSGTCTNKDCPTASAVGGHHVVSRASTVTWKPRRKNKRSINDSDNIARGRNSSSWHWKLQERSDSEIANDNRMNVHPSQRGFFFSLYHCPPLSKIIRYLRRSPPLQKPMQSARLGAFCTSDMQPGSAMKRSISIESDGEQAQFDGPSAVGLKVKPYV